METLRQGLEVPENDKALTPAPQAEETPVAENAPAAADAPENAGAPEAAAAPAATETPAATDTTVAEQSEAPAPDEDDAPDGEAMLDIEEEEARALRQPDTRTKDDILAELTELAAKDAAEIAREDIARSKQRFYALRKLELEAELEAYLAEGNDPEAFKPALDPAEEQLKALLTEIRDKKAVLAAAEEARRAENLARKRALIEELNSLAADTDNVNRAFPRVKEIQAEFKAIGEVPPTDATELWKSYQGAVEQFYDQLKVNKDLRDYDFRKNLELKTLLCEEAEKTAAEDDIVLAFKRLQNLHDEWRETGPVAKEQREAIWARFKEASAVINKRYQTFFEERKAREAENEKAKTEICERVEALDFSSIKGYAGWDEMTEKILAAQAEWKKIGFASRKVNNALFARFRGVCDKFFTLKAEHYRAMKDELAANLEKKIALCEKAEALKDSTDWRKTADALVALQKEWKTVGAVAKKHSDTVWRRFQQACDSFFENRKKNYSDSRSVEQANLQAKRQVIADLKAIPLDSPRAEAMPKVKELQARWQEIGHVPFREKDRIYDEYRAVCDALYNSLGGQRAERNRSRFEDVLKEMGSDQQQLYRERERILRQCDIKRNELKTYENNLGFLSSKSKSGDSMVREMERRIQRIKDDLDATLAKVKLIDEKLAKKA